MNQYIDHTNLRPTATVGDIELLCQEAIQYKFYAVCVNGNYIHHAVDLLNDTDVKVAAVAGFPLGSNNLNAKLNEIDLLIAAGADEIDMVINIGYVKSGFWQDVEAEIAMAKVIASDVTLKLILETCYLTDEEIKRICTIAVNEEIDFVKTSTGFGKAGATLHHVNLLKQSVGNKVKIKASGGIRDKETAQLYIDAGVERIGTSSGVKIVND